jgi:hypothetical protein
MAHPKMVTQEAVRTAIAAILDRQETITSAWALHGLRP